MRELPSREPEHEVAGEAPRVSLHGLDEHFGLHAVERRKIRIEHDPVPAKHVDRMLDPFHGDKTRHLHAP
jgi:hypothetical protein